MIQLPKKVYIGAFAAICFSLGMGLGEKAVEYLGPVHITPLWFILAPIMTIWLGYKAFKTKD